MSLFQLLLFILAGVLFYLFFKQLFSGDHPKRGVDFEANVPDEQIGGVSRPDKTFSQPQVQPTRLDQLLKIADESVEKGDMLEASKALQSALIVEPENIEVLQRHGYVMLQIENYEEAKEGFEKVISIDANDDTAHTSLANAMHKLGDNENALIHHEKAINIDPEYAPHHYNYANTLHDMERNADALDAYKKAYELDNNLSEAKEMIDKLSE